MEKIMTSILHAKNTWEQVSRDTINIRDEGWLEWIPMDLDTYSTFRHYLNRFNWDF